MLNRFFHLNQMKTSVATEVMAGMTTFLTMSYILFLNPSILGAAGMPMSSVMVATCLAAAIPTLFMGLWSNYPFALAPGMGLNAFIAFTIVKAKGFSWESAMALIVIEGVLITVLVLTQFRQQVMEAIPLSLKKTIGAGIGLFIALIGLKNAGFIVPSEATLVTFGNFGSTETLLALAGLLLTAFLLSRRVRGALLLGILGTTLVAIFKGQAAWPEHLMAWPDFGTVGGFVRGFEPLASLSVIPLVLALMLSDFFDTMGTVVAVGGEGGFLERKGNLPRLGRVLIVDSLAAVLGGVFGASSSTTYIESASGVTAGGRTGLTAVVVSLLFLLCIFFSPLAALVQPYATAPALILVGFAMMTVVTEISWGRLEEGLPAFATFIMIPFTGSISDGIGCGVLVYVVMQVFTGNRHNLSWPIIVMFLLFAYSLSPWAIR